MPGSSLNDLHMLTFNLRKTLWRGCKHHPISQVLILRHREVKWQEYNAAKKCCVQEPQAGQSSSRAASV